MTGKSWDAFRPLLGPAMNATYSLSYAQVPAFPPGVTFLSSQYLGPYRTNCTMFSAYFLGNGFGVPFSLDQWNEWQVAKGANKSAYRGYGPRVTEEWGCGVMMATTALPVDAVYLVQSFTTWPKGHSWMVLDFDRDTGKMLTLESNTSGSGINGVGFMDLGPIRTTNAANWKSRVKTTWYDRTRNYSEVIMSRLDIDHDSVLAWIAAQS